MKSALLATVMILLMVSAYASAQMGHEHHMMDHDTQQKGHDTDVMKEHDMKHEGMQHEGHDMEMLEHHRMMTDMAELTQDMSNMMRNMSDKMDHMCAMEGGMTPEKMHHVHGVIRSIGDELEKLSDIMGKGLMTDEELEKVRSRLDEIQKRIGGMK